MKSRTLQKIESLEAELAAVNRKLDSVNELPLLAQFKKSGYQNASQLALYVRGLTGQFIDGTTLEVCPKGVLGFLNYPATLQAWVLAGKNGKTQAQRAKKIVRIVSFINTARAAHANANANADANANAQIPPQTLPEVLVWLAAQNRIFSTELRMRLLPLDLLPSAVINEINERALDLVGELALEEAGEELVVANEILDQVLANWDVDQS